MLQGYVGVLLENPLSVRWTCAMPVAAVWSASTRPRQWHPGAQRNFLWDAEGFTTRKFSQKLNNCTVLSDEQMRNGWPFLLNNEQMSNMVGVEHQAENHQRLFGVEGYGDFFGAKKWTQKISRRKNLKYKDCTILLTVFERLEFICGQLRVFVLLSILSSSLTALRAVSYLIWSAIWEPGMRTSIGTAKSIHQITQWICQISK